MNKNITINGKKITIPQPTYNQQNANSILFAGYIHQTIDAHEIGISNIDIKQQDQDEVFSQLELAESFLFLGINAMGEIISATDADELEDKTLSNVGYLLSTITSLLQEIKHTRNMLTHSLEQKKDLS